MTLPKKIMPQIWGRLSLALFLLIALLKYYATFGADTSAFDYINLYLYGGLFDAPVAPLLPLLQLLLLAALVSFISRAVVGTRMLEQHNDSRWLPWAVALIALLLPLAYALATRLELYNEMRHFLFLLPPIVVLAGVSAELLCTYLQQWRSAVPCVTVIGLVLLYFGLHIATLVRILPYEYVFYNHLVGGVKGAEKHF